MFARLASNSITDIYAPSQVGVLREVMTQLQIVDAVAVDAAEVA